MLQLNIHLETITGHPNHSLCWTQMPAAQCSVLAPLCSVPTLSHPTATSHVHPGSVPVLMEEHCECKTH